MRIRRAAPGDAQAIVTLVERCYRGDESRRGWTTEADLWAGQRTDLQAVTALLLAQTAAKEAILLGEVVCRRNGPLPYGQPQFGRPLRDDLYFCIMIKTL